MPIRSPSTACRQGAEPALVTGDAEGEAKKVRIRTGGRQQAGGAARAKKIRAVRNGRVIRISGGISLRLEPPTHLAVFGADELSSALLRAPSLIRADAQRRPQRHAHRARPRFGPMAATANASKQQVVAQQLALRGPDEITLAGLVSARRGPQARNHCLRSDQRRALCAAVARAGSPAAASQDDRALPARA